MPEEENKYLSLYVEALCTKINHVESYLKEAGIVNEIPVYLNEENNTIEIHFSCTDSIYVKALARLLGVLKSEFCKIDGKILIFAFPNELNENQMSLSNNFFNKHPLENIKNIFDTTLFKHIAHYAIEEFITLRSKNITEKNYKTIQLEISQAETIYELANYIDDIRKIIQQAKGKVILFGAEYNKFFRIGRPSLKTIPEELEEYVSEEESKESYYYVRK